MLVYALSEMAHTSRDDTFFDVVRHCTLCDEFNFNRFWKLKKKSVGIKQLSFYVV